MSNLLPVLKRISAMRTTAFRAPLAWYSNGERGHLHAYTHCDKLDRKRMSFVRNLSLLDALEKTVCGECVSYGSWTDDQRKIIETAQMLTRAGNELDNSDYQARQAGKSPLQIVQSIAQYERVSEALASHEPGELGTWWQELVDRARDSRPVDPTHDELLAATLRVAVPQVIKLRLRAETLPPRFWGNLHQALPEQLRNRRVSYRENPWSSFANSWLDKLSTHGDPLQAGRYLLDNEAVFAELVSTPDNSTLAHVTTEFAPEIGESVWDYTTRTWRHLCHKVMESMLEAAVAYHDELAADAPLVIVANKRRTANRMRDSAIHGDVAGIVCAAQRNLSYKSADRDPGSGRCLLVCHPTVAAYITGDTDGRGYSEWSPPVPYTDKHTDDVLETALALWDPYSQSDAYSTFQAALAAAELL